MLPRSCSVNTFPDTPPALRLTSDPPEVYELAPAYSLEAARREQDRQWVSEAHQKYHRMVFKYVLVRTCNYHTAEDVTQQCFTRLLEIDRHEIRNIRAFLLGSAKGFMGRAIQDARLKVKTRRFADLRGGRGPITVARIELPQAVAEYHETRQQVEDVLNATTEAQARRLRMRLYDGMELREIAEAEGGLNKQTLCQRMKLQLDKLRAKFSDRMPTNKPIRLVKPGGAHWHFRMHHLVWCVELQRGFDRVADAAAFVNRDQATISSALTGRCETAAGYHWQWKKRPNGPRPISPNSLANINARQA